MNANRQFRTWQERLKTKMREWESSKQDTGVLLRGVPLMEAEDWLEKRPTDLTKVEQNYIKTSLKQRKQEQMERQLRRGGITILLLSLALIGGVAIRASIEQQRLRKANQNIHNEREIALKLAFQKLCTLDAVEKNIDSVQNTLLEVQHTAPNMTAIIAQVQNAKNQLSKAKPLLPRERSPAVAELQLKLKRLGYYHGSINEVYGLATRQAVVKFQKDTGLVPDGIVGLQTLTALKVGDCR